MEQQRRLTRARVAAYKVCWPPVDGDECFGVDILAAFDVAIHDGVDLLCRSRRPSHTFLQRQSLLAPSMLCEAWHFPSYVVLANNVTFKGEFISNSLAHNKLYPLISAKAKATNASVRSKRSITNKSNREAAKINHAVGTKSVAQMIYEKKLELRESTSLSQDEIFAHILPSISTAFRGIGVIPKPNTLRATQEVAALRKELEEYKRREKENNVTHVESLKKNQQLEGRLAEMEKKVKILL
ncbi:hypothetical protein FNV43_RR00018 [Rhamnella rubrinervis]|uniref:Uncharacterized protein n=1 Tax=Rhamnella rubrinervis TaxID=2594499 RepID=A0A8K0HND9_9ROSA|nr:hypothetical protein FNV43_RR00018 [Rhamnella rubrinervis]